MNAASPSSPSDGVRRREESTIPPAPISVLARLPWLLAMTALLLVVLCYPLHLRDEWRNAIVRGWQSRAADSAWARMCLDQFEGFISFLYFPLAIKGVVAGACLLAVLGVMGAAHVLRARSVSGAGLDRNRKAQRWRYFFLPLLLGWASISVAWSPTRALSAEAAIWMILFGATAFVLLRRGLRPVEVRQLAWLFMALGALVGALSLLQATELFGGVVFDFFAKFDDTRNARGSLMGHNTAVASFMMVTLFPALAVTASRRNRPLLRLLALGYVLFAFITILAVQSRAVWLLCIILVPAFLFIAARRGVARIPRWLATALLAMTALIIASQAVRAPWNPLYIEGNPIGSRVKDFTPRQLLKETRLRALVCSAPLVADRPLFGHGLYSFRSIYPKAQANYLALHPESGLGRTVRRLQRAHNEYLQVLIELGLVGLVLLLCFGGELAVRGLRLNRALEPGPRLLHLAFGFSALALAVQALVDFPLHVPQIALPWIFCIAAWGAIRPSSLADLEDQPAEEPFLARDRRTLRASQVSRLVTAGILVFVVPLAVYPFARILQTDADFRFASSYYEAFRKIKPGTAPALEGRLLSAAVERLRRTIALRPTHDLARFLLGHAYLSQAQAIGRTEAGLPPGVGSPGPGAIRLLEQAAESVELSMRSLAYHEPYYLLALIHRGFLSLAPHSEPETHNSAYFDNLRLAAYYAPTHVNSLYLRAESLARVRPNPDMRLVNELRRRIRAVDPAFYSRQYILMVASRLDAHDFEGAVPGAEALLQVEDQSPEGYLIAIRAHVMNGEPENRRRALELIERFRGLSPESFNLPVHPIYDSFGELFDALLRGQWARATGELDRHPPGPPRRRAILFNIEAELRRRLGRRGLPTRYARPAGLSPPAWRRMVLEQRVGVRLRLFADPAGALRAFESRLEGTDEEEAPPVEFWIDAAYMARRLGDSELEQRAISRVESLAPNSMALSTLRMPR